MHFTRIIQNKTYRVREGLLPGITEQDCSDQMNILTNVLLPQLDEAPFAIAHGDLAPQNTLIDAQHNIMGSVRGFPRVRAGVLTAAVLSIGDFHQGCPSNRQPVSPDFSPSRTLT